MNKHRVLVVDDEPNLSDLVRLHLERSKRFEVRVENRSGCAVAVAREFRPHIVLLDVEMPGMNGGEVARALEADPELRATPVLFFTSLITRDETGERETVRGGMRFLAKPVNPKVLIESVDRVLAASAKST